MPLYATSGLSTLSEVVVEGSASGRRTCDRVLDEPARAGHVELTPGHTRPGGEGDRHTLLNRTYPVAGDNGLEYLFQ